MLNISTPTDQVTEEDMRGLLDQLPAPMILPWTQSTMGKWKNEHKRENVRKNPQQKQPLVPQQKWRNLLQSIWWLQINNILNTCQPNDSSRVQMEQRIWTQKKWSLPHYHRRWKTSLHQTTSEMEHKKSKLNAISERNWKIAKKVQDQNTIEEAHNYLVKTILQAAEETIPKHPQRQRKEPQ